MPLLDIIPCLLSKASSTDFSPLARQLVSSVEAIHHSKHLLVDVKTENFMISFGRAKLSIRNVTQRLRIIDLGLVRPWLAQKTTDGQFLCTARYASLRMHQGNTPSRCDDLESLLYIIAELTICAYCSQKKNETSLNYLPWAREKSDHAIYVCKQRQVKDLQSDFYQRMPPSVRMVILKCLGMVWNLDFREEPDYERLKGMLAIDIPKCASEASTSDLTAQVACRNVLRDLQEPSVPLPSDSAKKPAQNKGVTPTTKHNNNNKKKKAVTFASPLVI